jgi:AcrR family transcriptional regulator
MGIASCRVGRLVMHQARWYSTAVENICLQFPSAIQLRRFSIKQASKPAENPGGRPAQISREKVLQAARRLRPHELTMNAVAERLDVRKASLYYYFNSKQELLAALGADLVRDLKVPSPDPANWRRWLQRAATSLFEVFCANPVFLGFENYNQYARAVLPLQEAAMETLEEAGFERGDVLRIWRVITSYVYVAAAGVQEAARPEADRVAGEIIEVLTQAERVRPMPRLRALAEQRIDADPRQRFSETLAWQIKSLPDPPAPKPRSRRASITTTSAIE